MWGRTGRRRPRGCVPLPAIVLAALSLTLLLPAVSASAGLVDRGRSDWVSDPAAFASSYQGSNVARAISDDGRYALYESTVTDFVPDFVDVNGPQSDVFLRDMITGRNLVVSRAQSPGLRTGDQGSGESVMSADGRFVAFTSWASDLDPTVVDRPGGQDIYVRDMVAGTTRMASVSWTGEESDGQNERPVISADGRYTVFASRAHNLVPGMPATFFGPQLYRWDRLTRLVELVTADLTGVGPANREINESTMSADGRFVAFSTCASDVVAGVADDPDTMDVFLRDMLLHTTTLVSRVQGSPLTAAGRSEYPVVSADGSTVAFNGYDAGVLAGFPDANDDSDIFAWSRPTGDVEVIDVASGGSSTASDGASQPRPSADGSVVAFLSQSSDLVAGYATGHPYPSGPPPTLDWLPNDLYARRRADHSTVLVNRRAGSATTSSDRGVTQPWLVTGGNLVVFGSDADDLVEGVTDTNRLVDLFAFRLDTAEMRAVSVDDSTGGAATTARQSYAPGWYSYFDRPVPAATPDGRFVVYTNYSGFGESLAIRRALEPPLPPPTPKPPLRPPPDFSNPPTTSGTPSLSAPSSRRGYWMVSSRGAVYAFGDAPWFGNAPTATAVDIEPAPSGDGYWVLDAAGRVFPFGGAARLGDAALRPGERAVSLSATADGGGYWVFTDHGRALAFGAAPFLGDMSGRAVNAPVLGSVVTPSGGGYWMVAADGGIFSFGDARFHGSMGGTPLNRPVMSMAPTPDGAGYWLVASDGGIFAFDAPFYGSAGQLRLNQPVAGLVPGRAGYLMAAADGGVFSFGDVAFSGSLGTNPPPAPVVAVALAP